MVPSTGRFRVAWWHDGTSQATPEAPPPNLVPSDRIGAGSRSGACNSSRATGDSNSWDPDSPATHRAKFHSRTSPNSGSGGSNAGTGIRAAGNQALQLTTEGEWTSRPFIFTLLFLVSGLWPLPSNPSDETAGAAPSTAAYPHACKFGWWKICPSAARPNEFRLAGKFGLFCLFPCPDSSRSD